MKTSRIGTHLLSVLLLLLWGGVMIYFHASGRLAKGEYVSKNGIFTTMVLIGGIGCVTVALFNLATMGAKEDDCCDHDHGHDHDHDHSKCGHDHSHDCGHDHSHETTCCGHDHSHDDHAHSHAHDHGHAHDHDDHEGHAHGILEESGALGRIVAILILVVPITYASINSPDGFKNVQTIANKGVYAQTYKTDAMAGKFDLNKADTTLPPTVKAKPAVQDLPPAATSAPATTAAKNPSPEVAAVANNPPPAAQTKSLGSFTLKDLEAQVPKSKEGNFMLEVPEIYYTAGDKEVQGVITGQSIETIAQVIPEKVNNEKGNRVRIFRMLIQCCAADARPYSVPVEFADKAPSFKDMSWVKVVGKMGYKKEGDQTVPVITAISMTAAAEPDNKMVY